MQKITLVSSVQIAESKVITITISAVFYNISIIIAYIRIMYDIRMYVAISGFGGIFTVVVFTESHSSIDRVLTKR